MYVIVTTNLDVVKYAEEHGVKVKRVIEGGKRRKKTLKKEEVPEFIRSLGIRTDYKGYKYIKYILERCIDEPGYHKLPITKSIYPECANNFNATVYGVERAIRYSIQDAYDNYPETFETFFCVKLKNVPTVGHFIAMIGEYAIETQKQI